MTRRLSARPPVAAPRRRANAAVEFALSGTLVLVLLFGLMEWGWTLYRWFGLQRASQAGARMAAVTDTDSDPAVAATAAAEAAMRQWGIDPARAAVTTSLTGEVGDRVVSVQVELQEGALVGLVPAPERSVALASQRYEEVLPPQVEED
ncbi:pilus assembly protein [Myxococcota bacterium]|nr:pilus assembly protein [Myxococcota bacterium]